ARARSEKARLGAMRAAQAEIDEALARCGKHHARSLGGDHRLKLQEVDHARLDQLSFGQRSGDAQDWFVGEEYRPFRHGVDVAGEAQGREIVDQVLAEPPTAREPIKLLRRKV